MRSKNDRIERIFIATTGFFLVLYAIFIVALIASCFFYSDMKSIFGTLFTPKTFHSLYLSLWTSSLATLLAMLIAIPSGYILAKFNFRGKRIIDMIINIPITLPPLVAGLSLLILFSTTLGKWIDNHIMNFSFSVAGIVLAQFFISASFAVILVKTAFEELDDSYEISARTLGCNRLKAFWKITLPTARYGIGAAMILTWSRAVGEFVPIMLFVGLVEWKTDILPLAIFINLEVGDLERSIGLTFLFIGTCLLVLPLANFLTGKGKEVTG